MIPEGSGEEEDGAAAADDDDDDSGGGVDDDDDDDWVHKARMRSMGGQGGSSVPAEATTDVETAMTRYPCCSSTFKRSLSICMSSESTGTSRS